jgi:S1-C subfamily serine protease
MKKLAVALLAFAFLCLGTYVARAQDASAGRADEWGIDEMNRQIDLTNVVVGTEADGGFCSGTIISVEKRLILTAAHCTTQNIKEKVVESEDPKTGEISKKTVRERLDMEIWHNRYSNFKRISSDRYVAKIIASNRDDDVAVLQVVDETWTPLLAAKLAPDDWKLRRGQKVYAVGNPGIEFDNSITDGIISNTERTLAIDGVTNQYFQFSAAIIGGSSGGSVLNTQGQIIGTVSAGVRGSNIGFGAPIAKTKTMLRSAGFGDVAGWPSKPLTQPQAGR